MMRCEELKPFKRHEYDESEFLNPFHYDHELMGTDIGHNVTVMFRHHDINKFIIVVDNKTGKRMKVIIEE